MTTTITPEERAELLRRHSITSYPPYFQEKYSELVKYTASPDVLRLLDALDEAESLLTQVLGEKWRTYRENPAFIGGDMGDVLGKLALTERELAGILAREKQDNETIINLKNALALAEQTYSNAGYRLCLAEGNARAMKAEAERDFFLRELLDYAAQFDGEWLPPAEFWTPGKTYTESEARALWARLAARETAGCCVSPESDKNACVSNSAKSETQREKGI